MKLEPLSDRVVIKPEKVSKTTEGGIMLPDVARQQGDYRQGEVLAVGPGKLLQDGTHTPVRMKPGDVVVYSAASSKRDLVRVGKDDGVLVIREDDVVAIVRE